MEPILRELWIHTLRAQAALRRQICASMARELEARTSTPERRSRLGYLRGESIKEADLLQLLADLLEREEREGRGEPSFVRSVA